MKIRINDIYNDEYNLISNNTLLLNDERLADLMEYATDLDIIIEEDFGVRELFTSLLKEVNDEEVYNLPKIHRSVYACFLANMVKYNNMLATIEELEAYNPSIEYSETKTYGVREKTLTHGAQSETKTYGNVNKTLTHGAQSETKTYGTVNTTVNTGQATDSTTNGQRNNTNSVVPSFGTANTFTGKDKTTGDSVTDSTTYGARSDSEQTTRGNDTTAQATYTDTDATTKGNDTIAKGTYTDTEAETETIDTVTGFKNKLDSIKERYGTVSRIDLVKLIANDVANQISFNLYL